MAKSVEDGAAQVETQLNKMYDEWASQSNRLLGVLEQGCPNWANWAESDDFPDEGQAKALIDNPSYPKLGVVAGKLDQIITVANTMNQTDACGHAFTDEMTTKITTARDFAWQTISCTYACFKIVRELPEETTLEGAKSLVDGLVEALAKKQFTMPVGLRKKADAKLASFDKKPAK